TQATYTFKCQLDGGGFSACTSPKAYSSVSEGSHTFQVEAVSGDGATTSVASYTWGIDLTAPTVTLTRVNGSAASFPLTTNQSVTSIGGACGTATGDSSTVSWSVSGGSTQSGSTSCSSGSWSATLTTALSSDGRYTVDAQQSDTAGNAGDST